MSSKKNFSANDMNITEQLFAGTPPTEDEGSPREIVVLPELEQFITPVVGDAYEQLFANIQEEGIRDKLVFWIQDDKDVLIDGHTRRRIALELNIPIPQNLRTYKEFDNIEQVKRWMSENQLGRRNLTPLEISFFRGQMYESDKHNLGGLRISNPDSDDKEKDSTANRLGKEQGVAGMTIQRDAQFYKGVMKIAEKKPDLKNKILQNQLEPGEKITKGSIQEIAKMDEVPEFSDLKELIVKLSESKPKKEIPKEKKYVKEVTQMMNDFVKNPNQEQAASIERRIKKILKDLI